MPAQRGLFTPVKAGPLELPHRIVRSPVTRIRAGDGIAVSEEAAPLVRSTKSSEVMLFDMP
jgi:2,4-dienoyl-CoA reductase-like NADH-dependent reductase (Old Yellow Enzyme family)